MSCPVERGGLGAWRDGRTSVAFTTAERSFVSTYHTDKYVALAAPRFADHYGCTCATPRRPLRIPEYADGPFAGYPAVLAISNFQPPIVRVRPHRVRCSACTLRATSRR